MPRTLNPRTAAAPGRLIRSSQNPIRPVASSTIKTEKPVKSESKPRVIIKATAAAANSTRNIPLTSEQAKKVARDFSREFQYYNAVKPTSKYRRRLGEFKKFNKWGQRKLAIMTVQFFTLHWDPKLHPKPICLYIGAAPGYTILIMNELFPQIEWHLYDRAKFPESVINAPNVTIHAQYFDDEEIEKWKGKDSLYLISDIRNQDYGIFNKDHARKWEAEAIVVKDMKMQEKWVYLLNPVSASLKFRLPWIEGYYKDNVGLFPHMQGYVYLQSWSGEASSEARFVPVRDAKGKFYSVLWDCKLYEDVMFLLNAEIRSIYKFKNPYGEGNVDDKHLIDDWDSANEIQIWRDFLNKVDQPDTQENVIKLSRNMTNILNSDPDRLSYKTLETIRYTSIDKETGKKVSSRKNIITVVEEEEKKSEIKKVTKKKDDKPTLFRKKKEESSEEEIEEKESNEEDEDEDEDEE